MGMSKLRGPLTTSTMPPDISTFEKFSLLHPQQRDLVREDGHQRLALEIARPLRSYVH